VSLGLREESRLDVVKDRGQRRYELAALDRGLLLMRLVAAGHEDAVLFHVARADFDANRHALLHPAPHLVAAAHVALIQVDDDRPAAVGHAAQLDRQLSAVVDRRPVLARGG
jgi:hypothetical protein